MKVVILAGGMPSTISEDRTGIPKPMATIGEMPMLWHIMKNFSAYGFREFVVCGGYKVEMIKDYFADFYLYQSDITVDLKNNKIEIHKNVTEDWQVTVVDTGLYSSTGQRISLVEKYIDGEEFIVTYGDCLSDVDFDSLLEEHHKAGKWATMVVAKPTGRNKLISVSEDGSYRRASREDYAQAYASAYTDANIYVFGRKVFSLLNGNYSLEDQLFQILSQKKQMAVYKHDGFWIPVETNRDKTDIENMWNAGIAPWKNWQ